MTTFPKVSNRLDYETLSSPMIGKYCVSQSPFSVVSTVSSLAMMCKSDYSATMRVFNASYDIVGELLNTTLLKVISLLPVL